MLSRFLAGFTVSKDLSGQVSPECSTFLFCILSFDSYFPLMRCHWYFPQVLLCPKTFLVRFLQTQLLSCSASFLPFLSFPHILLLSICMLFLYVNSCTYGAVYYSPNGDYQYVCSQDYIFVTYFIVPCTLLFPQALHCPLDFFSPSLSLGRTSGFSFPFSSSASPEVPSQRLY